MDLPDPPSPGQLAEAGIHIDEPAPPELGGEMTDDQLRDIANGGTDPYAHMSDDHLRAIAAGVDPTKYDHLSDKELRRLAGMTSGGLEEDRAAQTTGSKVSDAIGAFTHGINAQHQVPFTDLKMSWNPMLWGPQVGQYAANKALDTHNTDITDAIDNYLVPNPKDSGINKAMDAAGSMAMSVPAVGGVLKGAAAIPYAGAPVRAALGPYLKWAEPGAGFLGKTGQYVSNTLRAVPRTGQALLKGAAAPAGAGASGAAAYVGANAGAGLGQDVAHQMTKGASPWISAPAEILGSLVAPATAGYAKYLAPSMWTKRILKSVLDDASGKTENAIKYLPADSVLDKFKPHPKLVEQYEGLQSPEAQQGLVDAARLRDKITNFNPTLGEATNLASAKTQQANIEGNAGGNILDQYANRKAQQEQALIDYAQSAGPGQATRGDTATIDRAAKARVESVQQPLNEKLASVQTGREGVADTIPEAKAYDTGNYLRDRMEKLRTDKLSDMGKLADDMGLNDAKNLRVSPQGLRDGVKTALKKESDMAFGLSPTLKKLDKLDVSQPLAFKDAQFYVQQLGEEARTAAKNGQNNTARILGDARDGVDKYLTDEWAPALGIGDKYKAYRQTYKSEYIDRFGSGDAKTVGSVDGGNNYRTDNENVAGKFWSPGDVTSAQNFHRTFGGDPQALEALQAHVLDDVRKATMKDGVIDPAKMTKWMAANKDNLAQFPGLEAKLKNAQSLNSSMADRAVTLNSRQQAIEDTQLAKSLGTGNTYETMMKNPALLKRTVASMSDGEKKAMSRRMWSDATSKIDNPDNLGTFLKDHGEQLSTVMSKEHVENLQDLHKALTMNARSRMPVGTNAIVSPLERFTQSTGVSPKGVLSLGRAMARHMMSPEYVMADLLTRMGIATTNLSSKKMMGRAIYDPVFADKLSRFINNPTAGKAEGFKSYMLNVGIKSIADQNEEDQ